MSNSKTSNYYLNQWVKSDRVLMSEFNEDNRKIDAALGSLQSAVSSLNTGKASASALNSLSQTVSSHTSELGKRGNCTIALHRYTGNGKYGESNPNTVTFPHHPSVVAIGRGGGWVVMLDGDTSTWPVAGASGRGVIHFTISGSTVQWYSDTAGSQMNDIATTYTAIAFCKLS